jgi:LPXTG-motif cell wall-anchored protein
MGLTPRRTGYEYIWERPSITYILGMLFIFFGERFAVGTRSVALMGLNIFGVLLVLFATGVGVQALMKAEGDNRKAQFLVVLAYVGGLVALLAYLFTSDWGLGVLGLSTEDPKTIARFTTPMAVIYGILIAVSLIPLVMMEASRGFFRPSLKDEGTVEIIRIREMATSGLTIGLALSFLMVTCHIADDKNVRKDVSYFKTSSPGDATVNIVNSLTTPLKVYLFYPDPNNVKEELLGYFGALEKATGKLEVVEADREANPEQAKEYKVTADGTVVFVYGDKSEKLQISHEMKRARGKQLRTLDSSVQKTLFKVIRAKRIAYLTTGHGELNSPDTIGALKKGRIARPKATLLKTHLQRLNYQVKDLAPFDLISGVPDDATMIISLAPMVPFSDEEKVALEKYLSEGGALLLGLDPEGEADLSGLEGRLGVKYVNTALADDKEFVPQRRVASDHAFLKTNQFSSHASVTTLSRRGAQLGILLIRPGHLVDQDFDVEGGDPKRTYVVRTMNSAFADENGDFLFNEGVEKRQRYNVAAAIEDANASKPDADGEAKQARQGMRAMVIADAEVFADELQVRVPLLQDLVYDALNWLGGEEQFAGETKSEQDVKIEHTKEEDKRRFWATIAGAPGLILALGFFFARRRRKGGSQ